MKIENKDVVYIIIIGLLVFSIPLIFIFQNIMKEYTGTDVADSTNKVEITFTSSWAGTDTKSNGLKKIIDDFEAENPDIVVNNKSISGDEFLFTLKTDFAQGNDPDVFGLWPGSDINSLIAEGKIADLTPDLDNDIDWKNSFGCEAWDYDMVDGKIYGLPCEIIYEGLYINKDLFDKYNVNVPKTYEDLVSAVKTFRSHGVIPIAYNSTAEGTYIYQNIVASLGGKENIHHPMVNGNFNECFVKGMYYMRDLYNMGAFPKDAFIIDNATRDNLFKEKKAAMIVQGSWFIGEGALDGDDSSVELVNFPKFSEGTSKDSSMIYGIGNGNFHMSEKAYINPKKREASLRFLKYLTSEQSAKILNRSSGFISNIYIPSKERTTTKLNERGEQLVKSSEELIGPTDSFVDRNKWESILVPEFPKMLENVISPEQLLDEMERSK